MTVTTKITFIALVAFAISSCSPNSNTSPMPASEQSTDFSNASFAVTAAPEIPLDIPSDYANCTFNGQTVNHGASVDAYQNSSVAFGASCVQESRTCNNGVLSGSFAYANCNVATPSSCLFNGQTITHGQSIQAFSNSNVAYGETCQSETRTCSDGILSGSNSFASCQVAAPASCLFNGQTLNHGQVITAFQNSTQAYGTQCISEQRTCSNGVISGSYQYSSCNVDSAKSCLFNGQTIAHGQSVQAFPTSSVDFGSNCISDTRTCNDGVLSGSNQFATCNVNAAASCLFNGQTIAHNQTVKAFETSTVAFGGSCVAEDRLCYNGVLEGDSQFASCTVDQPASCLINGLTIAHGQSTILFKEAKVPNGQACEPESRICNNGSLSGSFTQSTCEVDAPKTCSFNGQILTQGQSIDAFVSDSVAYNESCKSEVRTCTDGVLSGSNSFATCKSEDPKSCSFNNKNILHGQSIEAFQSSSVPYGETCKSEVRTCTNGVLSGSNTKSTCVVESKPPVTEPPVVTPPKACLFNGKSIAHGATVQAFKSSSVGYGQKCESETRTCNDGILSGSNTSSSCQVESAKSCKILFGLITIPHGFTIWAAANTTAGHGTRCEAEITLCNNGKFVIDPSLTCQHGDKPPVTVPPPKKDEVQCELDVHSDNGKHVGIEHDGKHADSGLHLGWYKGDKPCKEKSEPKPPVVPPQPKDPCEHKDNPKKPCAHKKDPKKPCDQKSAPKKPCDKNKK